MSSKEQFYVTLPSNSSLDIFPQNTISEYVTQLCQPIELEGEWEVGLVECQYPRSINNVTKKQNRLYYKASKTAPFYPLEMQVGFYSSINNFIRAINDKLKNHDPQALSKVKFSYNKTSGRVKITISNDTGGVSFDDDIAAILGFEVPFQRVITTTTTSLRAADIHGGIYSLYIYCNIIQPQFVGDTQVQLLKIVPIEGEHGQVVTKTYQNPQYIPLLQRQFNTIEINIKDSTGKFIQFESGHSSVLLHLKRSSNLINLI